VYTASYDSLLSVPTNGYKPLALPREQEKS